MKKQKPLTWVLIALLAISVILNGWLFSMVSGEQSELTPENAPANNNCAPFDIGSSVSECVHNCKAADCEITYSSGCTWCAPWCERHFNRNLPSGDYLCYCNDCNVDESTNTLSCRCYTRYHGMEEVSLDLNTCEDHGGRVHVMYDRHGMFMC